MSGYQWTVRGTCQKYWWVQTVCGALSVAYPTRGGVHVMWGGGVEEFPCERVSDAHLSWGCKLFELKPGNPEGVVG